jgi:hypothetical protein
LGIDPDQILNQWVNINRVLWRSWADPMWENQL